LVIETSQYYDARSEEHQIVQYRHLFYICTVLFIYYLKCTIVQKYLS